MKIPDSAMSALLAACVSLVVLAGPPGVAAQKVRAPNPPRNDMRTLGKVGGNSYLWANGRAWQSLSKDAKVAMLAGIEQGVVLSVRENWDAVSKQTQPTLVSTAARLTVGGFTFDQLVQQITNFYQMPGDMDVPVVDAYLYAVMKLKKAPEDRLKAMVNRLRNKVKATGFGSSSGNAQQAKTHGRSGFWGWAGAVATTAANIEAARSQSQAAANAQQAEAQAEAAQQQAQAEAQAAQQLAARNAAQAAAAQRQAAQAEAQAAAAQRQATAAQRTAGSYNRPTSGATSQAQRPPLRVQVVSGSVQAGNPLQTVNTCGQSVDNARETEWKESFRYSVWSNQPARVNLTITLSNGDTVHRQFTIPLGGTVPDEFTWDVGCGFYPPQKLTISNIHLDDGSPM